MKRFKQSPIQKPILLGCVMALYKCVCHAKWRPDYGLLLRRLNRSALLFVLSFSLSALSIAASSLPSPDPAQAWADLQAKAALNGLVQASVFYQGKDTEVLVLSKKRFHTKLQQNQALQAARLIQRDVAIFCANHCRALPMPSPQLQADGRLRFVLRLTGLGRQLFQEELQALLSGSTALPAAQTSSDAGSPSILAPHKKAQAPRGNI